MSSLSISTNSPYISAVIAQQQVLGDQAQVQNDLAQLRQDQTQLQKDTVLSVEAQQQSQRAVIDQGLQARQAGLDQLTRKALAVPQPSTASTPAPLPQPTVNTSGQTVGKIINVVA
jgi:uncharacterized protein YdeI (YjbR/CyaY-like superfamily)